MERIHYELHFCQKYVFPEIGNTLLAKPCPCCITSRVCITTVPVVACRGQGNLAYAGRHFSFTLRYTDADICTFHIYGCETPLNMFLFTLSLFYASTLLLFLCARRNQRLVVDQYKKANVNRFKRASTKKRSPDSDSERAETAKRIPSGGGNAAEKGKKKMSGKKKNGSKKEKTKTQNKNERSSRPKTKLSKNDTLAPSTPPKKHERKRNKHDRKKSELFDF